MEAWDSPKEGTPSAMPFSHTLGKPVLGLVLDVVVAVERCFEVAPAQ